MIKRTPKQHAAVAVFGSIPGDVTNDDLIPRLIEAGASTTKKGAQSMIRRFTRGYWDTGNEILLERFHIDKTVYFRRA